MVEQELFRIEAVEAVVTFEEQIKLICTDRDLEILIPIACYKNCQSCWCSHPSESWSKQKEHDGSRWGRENAYNWLATGADRIISDCLLAGCMELGRPLLIPEFDVLPFMAMTFTDELLGIRLCTPLGVSFKLGILNTSTSVVTQWSQIRLPVLEIPLSILGLDDLVTKAPLSRQKIVEEWRKISTTVKLLQDKSCPNIPAQ